jgi:hypothetical protein
MEMILNVYDNEDKWTVYIFIRNLYFIRAIRTERPAADYQPQQ